jgi:CheY-like chemotaxis protein
MDAPIDILIVGRESSFTYLMHRYSTQSARTAVFASEHEDILALAQREHPDAIVLEIDTSERTGWDLVHQLKTHPDTRSIPLVLCSWDDIERQCIEKGVDAYIHKPILYQDFEKALTRIGL